jgi:outer membrane protein assembly factor BamB
LNLKLVSITFSVVLLFNIITSLSPIISAPDPVSTESYGLADSPWPMFQGNLNHTGQSLYNTSDNTGKMRWSFNTGSYVFSSPAISSDGSIYIGSTDNNLYAVNPDGTEKWNFSTSGLIHSSPAINTEGTIFVGSKDGRLYAINPNGSEKWNFQTNSIIDSSPAIGPDGTIYVGSNDYKLYAINADGSKKWAFQAGNKIDDSSPAISSNGTIYIGSLDFNLYAIKPDGTKKWSYKTGSYVFSSPVIGYDGTIYIGSEDNKLHAINPDGTQKWSFTAGNNIYSSPAIGLDGTIYVGSTDFYLYAINPNGTKKWDFLTGFVVESSPSIGSDGTIYVGSKDNKLYAIYPNGTEKWNFTTGNGILSYIGSYDGNLYAIGNPNIPPIANASLDQTQNEGDTIQFNGSASYDPDGTIEIYEWDFDLDNGLWWETGAPVDATGPTPTHIYGDDGIFVTTLRVTDNDNLTATDICNITVLNVDPTAEIESATMQVEIGLRVTGRKFNDVGMTLYENGTSVGYVSIERLPGSPNEQMVWIPMTLDLTKTYSAVVTYIPEDPPDIGANPVWIYIKSENGSVNKIHHTFNVEQSKKRDSDHWNHIEPWEVGLNNHLSGLPFEVTSHITDPGSDDEILEYEYGSQIVTVEYMNNPPISDPYPSPEVNPRDIMDTMNMAYEGPGTITLMVEDDDSGSAIITMDIV